MNIKESKEGYMRRIRRKKGGNDAITMSKIFFFKSQGDKIVMNSERRGRKK